MNILDEILDRPKESGRAKAPKKPRRSLEQFLQEEIHTDFGLFSFKGHEPLLFLVRLIERLIVDRVCDATLAIEKAEQIGLSTLAIGIATWCVAEMDLNCGYFLPDDKLASEFGASRFGPTIERSLFLAGKMKDAGVDRGVLKELGDGKYLYLRGLTPGKMGEVPTGTISAPMDFQLLDEFDKIAPKVAKWTSGRMAASQIRVALRFSAPYSQNSGIDKSFSDGTQHRWLVKCVSCGKSDICLEEAFPECMREFNGKWVRVCPECKKKLDIVENGQWVASEKEREKDGKFSFRISALSIGAIDAGFIMAAYEAAIESGDPDDMAVFDRTKRALANAGAMQPITDLELRMMSQGNDYVLSTRRVSNPVFFGVDAGNKCWFYAEEYLPEGRPRMIYAEVLNSDRWVERVTELIGLLNPRYGVVDSMPWGTDSRKLAYAFPQNIALLRFENGRLIPVLSKERLVVEEAIGGAQRPAGPEYQEVKIDRDFCLGKFCAQATNVNRFLLMPNQKSPVMKLVCDHFKKLQKVVVNQQAGNELHRFLDKVENHFGMAAAMAWLARQIAPLITPFAFYSCEQRGGIDIDGDEDFRDMGGFV